MTDSKFDISSFRAEAPLPSNSAPSRGDRAGDTPFADILRAHNTERDLPAEPRNDDMPRDDMPTSSVDKPAPRHATKDKDAPSKPRQNDATRSDAPQTPNDAATPDKPEAPKAAQSEPGMTDQGNATPSDAVTAPSPETTTDASALAAAAAAAALAMPAVPAPIVVTAAPVMSDGAATAAATNKSAAPSQPVPIPAADAATAGTAPAPAEAPQDDAATQNTATVAPNAGAEPAAPEFDQLVAAAMRALPPRETRKSASIDIPVSATPAKPAAASPQPVAIPAAAAAAQPPVATPVASLHIGDAASASDATADDAGAMDAETEAASLAALVKRTPAPRNAEPRTTAAPRTETVTLPEPSPSAEASVDAPAPRSGAGSLTAATGLAAQVKGQELQNTPQPSGTVANAAIVEKTPMEAAIADAASSEADPSVDGETPNTPSTARTSEGHAPQQAHDSSVRGTSFADALSAARGSRANANPLVAQVVVQVTKAVSEGSERITIKLSPADLGRIDVRLDIGTDGKIQAVFAADKPQTVEMLQRDARELERALQDAGLRADSGSLSFNLRGEQQQRDGDNSSFAGGRPGSGDVDALAEVPAAAAQIYSNTSAGNGRLDIHV